MTDPLSVTIVTTLLIVLSAFFVVIEFALLGARRHRLEAEAATSRSARAALRGINELTIMLAGAQLGITACTFALGAITKPAVDAWLGPVFASWGVPEGVAGGTAFALSLLFVTFLHLVVGEMAPKSWAIAHPEISAKLIGLPARGFIWCFRPLLSWVNEVANRLVAMSGVTPVESAAVGGQDADTIRHLVEHSAAAGALDASFRTQLSGVLELQKLTVKSLIAPGGTPTAVSGNATMADLQGAAARSRHLRILVEGGAGGAPGVVHVRDTLLEPPERRVGEIARPAFRLDAATPVYEALARIRSAGEQLAAVMEDGRFIGVITLSDVMSLVLPGSTQPAT
ncbi:CNNM domain-containing protein [Arthrobacter halodurans]|uniref:CNNM domain-containing protein n=1 Tax=Arthrobacter halodurans TaxID=516699 RepID=A0ABV4UT35_9MICC